MAPVRQRARIYYLVASLVSAAIALVCAVGVVMLLRQQRINRQLVEQGSLLDEAQDAIMVSDLDQRLTYWNRSAERLYGWPAAAVLGRTVPDVLYPHERALMDTARGQAEQAGTWLGELPPTARDGRRVVAQSRWTLVRDVDGHPISILTIDTDLTERRQLEQQFYRSQRLESLGALAGGIAHDLNNVLAPTMPATEVLHERMAGDDSRELLTKIVEIARRGAEMVGQVLSFARGQEGRRAEVQVGPLVAEVARISRDSLPKNIVIRVHVHNGLPPLTGDATQFHQVLLNLCVTARDAMADGERLSISAEALTLPAPSEPLLIDVPPGPCVVLQVEHTGVGVPPDEVERIFSTSLTIVKSRDEAAIRRVATLARERYGYRVLVAGDGVEGLALYQAHAAQIAVVVTDMMMPGLGGDGLIREQQRLNRTRVLRQTLAAVLAEPAAWRRRATGDCHLDRRAHTAGVLHRA